MVRFFLRRSVMALEKGALLAQLIAQELLRAVEDALCLLDGGLNLFDLPICRLAQPPRLLDKFPSTRNGLRRLTQIGSLR
jgi:hypothetical protein